MLNTEERRRERTVPTTVHRIYESVHDFTRDAIEHANPNGSGITGDDSWAGASWKAADEMGSGAGWTDVRDEVVSIAGRVSATVIANRDTQTFRYALDVEGGGVDVSQYLAGEEACMVSFVTDHVRSVGNVVRIIVPTCYSASVSKRTAMMRGAACVALIETLASIGMVLDIWSVLTMQGTRDRLRHRCTYSIHVQHADRPYDAAIVAFGVGHPAMLRRLAFAREEGESEKVRRAMGVYPNGHGYGAMPYEALPEDVPNTGMAGHEIILPALGHGEDGPWRSVETASVWVDEMLTRIESGDFITSVEGVTR